MKWFKRAFFNLFKPLVNEFLESRWNNNWRKGIIMFTVNSETQEKKDVRKSIACVSKTLEEKLRKIAKNITINCKNDDEKAFVIFEYVLGLITYIPDIKNYFKRDFWASPDETFSRKKGDCEDMAILQNELMRLSGVPAFRRKLCVGDTRFGYHCYLIYLRELENVWFLLDSSLVPQYSFDSWYSNIPHKLDELYISIDFSFNEQYSWSQKNLMLDEYTFLR